jgi:hypothetical protein
MVHWVYIVECEDNYIYVGETTRLYRRMNEHQNGGGSVNTGRHKPLFLVGLYKVADNISFFDYRLAINSGYYDNDIIREWGEDDSSYLDSENHFTELLMRLRSKENNPDFMFDDGEWWKVRGGKYTKTATPSTKSPISDMKDEYIIDRPCCECQYPCEVKISKDKKYIYFVCALKNVWKDFSPGLNYPDPCDFFQLYKDDVFLKKKYEITQKKLQESWCQYLPYSFEECIKCKNIQYSMVYSHGKRRQICIDCFDKHYEDLKKEYSIEECMITD